MTDKGIDTIVISLYMFLGYDGIEAISSIILIAVATHPLPTSILVNVILIGVIILLIKKTKTRRHNGSFKKNY
ncbi:hypothetical protein [Bacillus sp. E(2018)]|uniref:hypothetical protein n=1 Tax=Bacillus sp. E(2018) TaxID=2502239 RepID=UPI0010F8C62F|nr:hypothetical protein [Bacillus sp. E(2018)]